MKASFIFAAAVSVVVAQDLSGLPTCALKCLQDAIVSSGCGVTDVACQCGEKKAAIASASTPCLISSCTSASDLAQAATAGEAKCVALTASGAQSATAPAASSAAASSATAPTSTAVVATTTAVRTSAPAGTGAASPSGTLNTTSVASSIPTAAAAAQPAALGAGALMGLIGAIFAL